MIPFNKPTFTGNEYGYVREAIDSRCLSGNGMFTKRCEKWLEERFGAARVLLTCSGSAALDMAALLCDLHPGDEVIMPSFTFTSTANAFLCYGAVPVFVDIRPDTMNIDEKRIEAAITEKTRVIVVMHYAGVACEMNAVREIADRHGLRIVEDAAHGVMSRYCGKSLGTIGDLGCYSFHESKNYSMGEGGAIVINDPELIERAEIIREKGTNRIQFLNGQVDKYSWVDKGDSFLASEMNAAYLWAQLEKADEIFRSRMSVWTEYEKSFSEIQERYGFVLPSVPDGCEHNAHIFYLKCKDREERDSLIHDMRSYGITCTFHYIPLHSAEPGRRYCRFSGEDIFTTSESSRLVRLPIYYGMTPEELQTVIFRVRSFFDHSGS